MVFHPRLIPLFVELDGADEPLPRLREQAIQLLGLLVRLVDGVIEIGVGEFTRRPALEVVVEGLQDLAPAMVVIGVNQRLIPFLLR